ncbi:MAG: pyruvate:ferredoxin (flavodoxin) oxidoreductase [Deltaproteobacteria bacterium]|jgi:pyruvate-ferredoxin/flavodoxin oxidoreductase|nr:pyruvate:ferredoxin (flavodoxin) oxidoreductase [Deltaproteobacteria bacterium]
MPKSVAIMDGNTAAAHVSYAFTEVAGIFPITPSSPMAELVDEWAAKGRRNVFGQVVEVAEMQSEGGAAGAVHGSLGAGALTTTYTASQGLLLMIPNMYKIAGELLPGVFHVSARTLSTHALSIFGDHSDVMACRQTGFAMLASSNPQEIMDYGAVAHLSAIRGRLPFLHFFDGFRTSHEIQKIEALDYGDLKALIDMEALNKFRNRSLNPGHPSTRGTTQNPDIHFQQREASNLFHARLPETVQGYMDEVGRLTGRKLSLFEYYGDKEAEAVIVAMGSVCDTIKGTIDYLAAQGRKAGLINVHLYRPFSAQSLMRAIPASVKKVCVLDRTKEPGASGEPLYLDVCQAIRSSGREMEAVGGRYGLSSKDTTPAQIVAAYENLAAPKPKNGFTVGIVDDVTFLSLPAKKEIDISPKGEMSCKLWGMGSDGTVGANKNTVKIIGESTGLYAQAYFVYDSKKSGGLTQSHLRFGQEPIRAPYLVNSADFVACHNQSYVSKYDLAKDLKPGGLFLLNCQWSGDELDKNLPEELKKALWEKKARVYIINAVDLAKDLGMAGRTNVILQAAFLKLTSLLPIEEATLKMKEAIRKTYAKKGGEIVEKNLSMVDLGIKNLISLKVPESWGQKSGKEIERKREMPAFIEKVAMVMNRQEGDVLPVSAFVGMEDGTFPPGSTAFEKRGAAVEVPKWSPADCAQCNRCSYVCPHAAVRPFLLDAEERKAAPSSFETLKAAGLTGFDYRIQVSPLDCAGCGSCVSACPAKTKALAMRPLESQLKEEENWKFAVEKVSVKGGIDYGKSVKNSQFAQPLFEFSGACAGCAETPYIKLVTQLFGDRMYVANASGCSTAYGGSTPSTPYTKNAEGRGPAWAMSLFEDCAEYAYGMLLGSEKIREKIKAMAESLAPAQELKGPIGSYLQAMEDSRLSQKASDDLQAALAGYKPKSPKEEEAARFILENKDFLPRKSYWAFGGDGWAYDIGYGGLDHVLASGRNINVLVLDTEVYSNTGGQSSKATAAGAIAKFNSSGKKTKKKDLGLMAMSYGYVYVAQVAMGYDQAQTLKAIREAEAYPGPSLIIAYCPCIEHGLKAGMGQSQQEMRKAVEAGYWHLYRFNPLLKKEGKNPFTLDSKEPTADLREFLRGENRYAALEIEFPDSAEELFLKAQEDARERYESYLRLADDGQELYSAPAKAGQL